MNLKANLKRIDDLTNTYQNFKLKKDKDECVYKIHEIINKINNENK